MSGLSVDIMPGRSGGKRGNPSSGQFSTWEREGQLNITAPGTALTDTPVLIDASVLPADIWTTAVNGGGDLRFAADYQGINRLACEIVDFNTGSMSAEIWVLVPSIAASVNTPIYFWYGQSGVAQPAAAAAFGQYATWPTDYRAVYHMESSGVDSTVNQVNPGATTATFTAGKIGGCADFEESSSQYIDYFLFPAITTDDFTFSTWYWPESNTFTGTFLSHDSNVNNTPHIEDQSGHNARMFMANNNPTLHDSVWTFTDSTWQHFICKYLSGSVQVDFRKDYANLDDDFFTTANNYDMDATSFTIGARWNGTAFTGFLDGKLDEVRMYSAALPDARLQFEYNNQNAPSGVLTYSNVIR